MSKRDQNDPIEISVEILRFTDLAVLVNDGAKEAWVPKSQIDGGYDLSRGHATITIPEWLAKDKGFV